MVFSLDANLGGSDPSGATESVAAETSLLDQARAALAEGRSADALELVDRYRARARTKLLGPEATILEVESLYTAGHVGRARRLATRYIETHTRGPQTARLRRFAEATAGEE